MVPRGDGVDAYRSDRANACGSLVVVFAGRRAVRASGVRPAARAARGGRTCGPPARGSL